MILNVLNAMSVSSDLMLQYGSRYRLNCFGVPEWSRHSNAEMEREKNFERELKLSSTKS